MAPRKKKQPSPTPIPRKRKQTSPAPSPARTAPPTEALESFLSLSHRDPHSFLGLHPDKDGIVIRVFRPNAQKVTAIFGGLEVGLASIRNTGLFEACIPDEKHQGPYQVRVEYAPDRIFTYWDPYSFWPTLGEMDLYLLGEGNHSRLHEKLGAHFKNWQGVDGFSFAVWAPGAKSVSVVGDFNGWDGRLHTMRCMGSSGIWELFIPDLKPDSNYKFEIRTPNGHRLLKADPYAFATEKPPLTASVIHHSRYEFHDEAWMLTAPKRILCANPCLYMKCISSPGGGSRRTEAGPSLTARWPINWRIT